MAKKSSYDKLSAEDQAVIRQAAKDSVRQDARAVGRPARRPRKPRCEKAVRSIVAQIDKGRVHRGDETRLRQVHYRRRSSRISSPASRQPNELGPRAGSIRTSRPSSRRLPVTAGSASGSSRSLASGAMSMLSIFILSRVVRSISTGHGWPSAAAGTALVLMTAIVGAQVFSRYVLNFLADLRRADGHPADGLVHLPGRGRRRSRKLPPRT